MRYAEAKKLGVSPNWTQTLRKRCEKRALCPNCANLAACANLGSFAACSIWTRPATCPSRASSSSHDGPRRHYRLRTDAHPRATRAGNLASPTRFVCPVSLSCDEPRRPSPYPARRCGAMACRFDCRHAPRMYCATLGFYSLVSRNRLSQRPVGRHLERHGVILTAPCRNVELPCPVSHGTRLHHHRERRCRRNHHSQGKADDD